MLFECFLEKRKESYFMKRYIFANPTMAPRKLTSNFTENCSQLSCLDQINIPVSFPILISLKNTVSEGETVKVTVIKKVGHDCTEKNYTTFLSELDAIMYDYDLYGLYRTYYKGLTQKQLQTKLQNERDNKEIDNDFMTWRQSEIDRIHQEKNPLFHCDIESIEIPCDEKPDTQVRLLFQIIQTLENSLDEDIYVDLSFGSKPIPIVMNMALTYAYQHGDGIFPKCMSYESFEYNGKETSSLYDVSSLLFLQSSIINLEKSDVSNPIKFIEKMMLDDNE